MGDGAYLSSKTPALLNLKRDAVTAKLAEYNTNPDLKWQLDKYESVPNSPCRHVIDTCTYQCNCETFSYPCGPDGSDECSGTSCETCIGNLVETVAYNYVYSLFSADTGKSFFQYDTNSKAVEEKKLAYKFGINWIDEQGRTTRCEP